MDRQTLNQVIVLAGSVLAVNGALLLVSPGRFAALRRAAWLPRRANDALDRLGQARTAGRGIGAAATAGGLALLVAGMRRVEPAA